MGILNLQVISSVQYDESFYNHTIAQLLECSSRTRCPFLLRNFDTMNSTWQRLCNFTNIHRTNQEKVMITPDVAEGQVTLLEVPCSCTIVSVSRSTYWAKASNVAKYDCEPLRAPFELIICPRLPLDVSFAIRPCVTQISLYSRPKF